LTERLGRNETAVRSFLDDSGMVLDDVSVSVVLDMSYVGQTHTVSVPVENLDTLSQADVLGAFEKKYEDTYGRVLESIAVRVLSARTTVVGTRPKIDPAALAPRPDATVPLAGERNVFFDGEWRPTAIWPRLELPSGWLCVGPAILEQPDATIVIEPGFTAEVDALGNVVITNASGA
jgi:N-methylhydantoinase A